MKIKGEIHKTFWAGINEVQFSNDAGLVASLYIGKEERRKDQYRLYLAGPNAPILQLQVKGWWNRRIIITRSHQPVDWLYKPGKWYDVFFQRRTLFTDTGPVEVHSPHQALEAHRENRKIGVVQKQFDGLFDKGEYYVSFADDIDLQIVMVLASILVIQSEVLDHRDSN